MPTFSSKDFTLHNSSPATAAQLDQALAYLQTSPTGAAIVAAMVESGVAIQFGAQDGYGAGQNTIVWNPDSGLVVLDRNGNVVGVTSAALMLLHEGVHAIDPQQISQEDTPNPNYTNEGEATALIYEAAVAREKGEPERTAWEGKPITVDNPTTHTTVEGGTVVWTQVSPQGVVENGPAYTEGEPRGGAAPEFGSTAPQQPIPNPPPPIEGDGNDGGDDPACVHVDSFLPGGITTAGNIRVGSTMELAHHETLEAGEGVVSFSQVKESRGYRITTESGASLVCSHTAPIPTRFGLKVPVQLLGHEVAVLWEEGSSKFANWEKVKTVEEIGLILVQHITVGDKCFWAGEKKGAYILHHNQKNVGGGGGGDGDPWWSDGIKKPATVDSLLTGHGTGHTTTTTTATTHAVVAPAHGPVPAHAPAQALPEHELVVVVGVAPVVDHHTVM